METNPIQSKVRKRLSKLEISIQESIDKICEEEEFDISYEEIIQALSNVTNKMNSQQLKTLWDDESKK